MSHKSFPAILAVAAVAGILGACPSARGQAAKSLGTFDQWAAYSHGAPSALVCYVYGEPQKQEGNYARRGDTYVQVAHRPKDKVTNEVSVTAGYDYRKDAEVELDIDGTKFALFTADGAAWARDTKTEGAIVKAMMSGRQMVVKGTSARGTLTTDTYSLKGFTAAVHAIDAACGVK
jgi:hypothetical protein